ncbi:MAG: rod shape-determining protein RodA, partial [Sphingomonadales bacterium]
MNAIVPAPIAALPWRVIFVLLGLAMFGTAVLYSAAGGSFSPWAGNHIIRFCVLMTMAVIMSRLPLDFWKQITFPLYLILLLMLVAVE